MLNLPRTSQTQPIPNALQGIARSSPGYSQGTSHFKEAKRRGDGEEELLYLERLKHKVEVCYLHNGADERSLLLTPTSKKLLCIQKRV